MALLTGVKQALISLGISRGSATSGGYLFKSRACSNVAISRGDYDAGSGVDRNNRVASQSYEWPIGVDGRPIRTAKARKLGISTSPWKLNLVARLVRKLSIQEAMRQMVAIRKKHRVEVASTIHAAVTNAKSFGMHEDRLIVSRAFVGKGHYLKRIRPWHGKGRFGIEHKKYCHLTIEVQELSDEEWEAKVLPQYIHLRYRQKDNRKRKVPENLVKPWLVRSQVDASLFATLKRVEGLRNVLPQRRHPFPADWKQPEGLASVVDFTSASSVIPQ